MPEPTYKGVPKDAITGIFLTIVFFTISAYFPLAGFFCTLFVPLPILFYRAKLGRKPGAVILAGALFVMVLLAGGVSADVIMFSELLLLGFVIGEFLEMRLSLERTVAFACGIVLATGFFGLLFYSAAANFSIFDLVTGYVRKNLELSLSLYDKMGMPQEHIHAIAASLDAIEYALVRVIPGLLTVFLLLVTWMNLLMARPIFAKKGLSYPNFGQLTRWKAPEVLVWGVIACGAFLLMPSKPIKMLGINGLLILMTVFFFEGIAIVAFFFDKKKIPGVIRVILFSLIAVQQLVLLLVIGLGFFDMWINFRRLENNHTE